jgi:hypothetical protein
MGIVEYSAEFIIDSLLVRVIFSLVEYFYSVFCIHVAGTTPNGRRRHNISARRTLAFVIARHGAAVIWRIPG